MSVLWPCTSPICFQKTHKDSHGPFKKDGETHSDLDDMLITCRTREETIGGAVWEGVKTGGTWTQQ